MVMKFRCLAVLLLTCPLAAATTIEKVLPFTPEVDTVRIVVQTSGGSGEVKGTIKPAGQNEVVWEGSLGSMDASGLIEKTLEKLKVQPWSPSSPKLYELTVTPAKGKPATVRFGFRKVECPIEHGFKLIDPKDLGHVAILAD